MVDKNLNKYLKEKEDITKYRHLYTFKNDNDILDSFLKIFDDYDLSYKPRTKTKVISSQYLLKKLDKSKKIPRELFRYFDENLRNQKKFNLHRRDNHRLLPEVDNEDNEDDAIAPIQDGRGNLNNIKIDKNILKIRYLNNRKLSNSLLKHDYKISKNMKDAIKFNKNIHKLSTNEKNIYYELEKYIHKDKSLDVLIGSYLSGNDNKKLFNRINKFYITNIKII